MKQKPVLVIGGPTASGKSALALALAGEFDGEVVNADSMQVYTDLQVVTARPTTEITDLAPHHLYGVLGMEARCSAGQWRALAITTIDEVHKRERLPIVVGGTGLYLKALMLGLHTMPSVPRDIREHLNQRLSEEGAAALYEELSSGDPATATDLYPADGQRIVRALEILLHTGRGLRSWQTDEVSEVPANLRFFAISLLPLRDDLYAAANTPFDEMLDGGAIDEVASLLERSPPDDFPLLKAVGVPPIRAYLGSEIDRERLRELGKRDTRRYAKRQMTWFRHQFVSEMSIETKYSEINRNKIFSKIRSFLLTD